MQGSYEPQLVLVSIFIAALAAYVAIEFAGRIDGPGGRRFGWLAAGALAMGSGIWSMHFVGMAALELPVAITFDIAITLLSWVAAVAVSAIALVLVTGSGLTSNRILFGALAMGAGICLMHYGGMWAMRMEPGIGYDPVWFGISVFIAVSASAAALFIVARLKQVRSWRDIGLRMGAAGIMGLAVAGMHYSGMAAARFSPDAFCAISNALSADCMAMPVVLISVLGLMLAISFAVADARAVLLRQRAERVEALRVVELAFVDASTGLPNRAQLARLVAERLGRGERLGLLSVAVEGDGEAPLKRMAESLARLPADLAVLARSGSDQLSLLLGTDDPAAIERWARRDLLPLLQPLESVGIELRWGLALAPADGTNAQMLLLRAGARDYTLRALFESAAADPLPQGA